MESPPYTRRQPQRSRRSSIAARSLICVPIVHTPADMGGLAQSVRNLRIRKLGRDAWGQSVDAVHQMWAEIREQVDRWELPWEKVRLYQDGLPLCDLHEEIARDLAQAGSLNHRLLLSLMARGATLMGTESPELLVEEYRLAQRVLGAKGADAGRTETEHQTYGRSLIAARDRFIAKRISQSLLAGETGVLFLGVLHAVEPLLEPDIRVSYPIWRPHAGRRRTS